MNNDMYPKHSDIAAAKDALTKLLTSKHCDAKGFELLGKEVENELNVLKRDALLPYAIHQDLNVENARKLYEKLLIDVKMDSCASTSKIKEAISAVQLFMHRYFINLESEEDAKLKSDQDRQVLLKRWQWMQNYRVWEANRKTFLYPENYLRPELRDTKTPEFKELEQELVQGELNETNITPVFKRFIDKYTELSQLKVAGGYVYPDEKKPKNKKLVLFGYTPSEPRRYYYRSVTFYDGRSDSVNWKPWKEVNIKINTDRVYPVFVLNRVYVFWAEIEQKSSTDSDSGVNINSEDNDTKVESNIVIESVLQIYYSYYDLNETWVPAQKLNYQITSNDTIADYFIDFSSSLEKAKTALDSILINCHYSTEKRIKLKFKDGNVNIQLLENKIFYLKAANTQRLHLISYPVDNVDNKEPTTAHVECFLPGDSFNKTENQFTKARIDDFMKNSYTLKLIKGLVGDGYTFHKETDEVLYFDNDDDGQIKIQNQEHLSQLDKRHATFQILENRNKEVSSFQFYPETRIVKSVKNNEMDTDEDKSGIKTFKALFPSEDINQLELPVLLHVPKDDKSLPWICFDYKGGSFLAKPVYGSPPSLYTISNKQGFSINAAFLANKDLYIFSKEGKFAKIDSSKLLPQEELTEEVGIIKTETETKTTWGRVAPTIQVDAACVIDGKIYLFICDQYVCCSNGCNQVDDGYPKQHKEITGWSSQIDAAFQFGGKSYFIKGDQYTCSDDLSTKKQLSELSASLTGVSSIDYALTKNGTLYLIN
jgi:hypothetical protein